MADSDSWPFTFACRRSGNCCARPAGFVRVSSDDVERIAAHLGLQPEAFIRRYTTAAVDGGLRLVDGLGSRCVFLADGRTAGCSIYPVRPARCASWPYWEELRPGSPVFDPSALAEAKRLCPGISASDGH